MSLILNIESEKKKKIFWFISKIYNYILNKVTPLMIEK